ncbi:glycosyltransferase [Actinokineospora auranticolor]|uniref:MGT family glycosyltransferase n=1 Tax=Actinokineospora auranticolor TaxID=155976 RepID=A0A2S6GUD2_9PSEU|nr:glycosyltransferase [Actinokineospora auranticolor]PPK68852.1 MGT family glycosyltransferase [Actinokineospora auranticolor]
MEILFTSLPAHGHTYPLLPLAIAARDAGHRVTYATWESFEEPLARLGFEFFRAGGDMQALFREVMAGFGVAEFDSPAGLDPQLIRRTAAAVFGRRMPENFIADLRPLMVERRFDLVVYEAANVGAGIAARAEGLPAVSHAVSRGGVIQTLPGFLEGLREIAAANGTEIDLDAGHEGRDRYLDIYPTSLQDEEVAAAPNRVPVRPVAFSEPGELPSWVPEHREKLIYLTLGTAFGNPAVLRAAIDGLAATGHRVLVSAGPTVDPAVLGTPPANVTVQSWVPQAELLPHLDLVVHHGGSGTTLGAAAAGVRQLFVPQGADQFLNATTFTEAGASRQLLGDDVTADAITSTALDLLADDAAADATAAVAKEISAMPAPGAVVARFTEFAQPVS